MDTKQITEQDLLGANTYMQIQDKIDFVNYAAQRCFDKVEIRTDGNVEADSGMPPYFKDSQERKNRYMMGALVRFYLKKEYEPVQGDEWLMSADDYDRYAGGHVINQIERMKSCARTRDRAFDLLADFRALEKMLNTEVYGMLQVMNDPVSRLNRMVFMQAKAAATPEVMRNAAMELDALRKEMESMKKRKEASGK